MVRRKKKALCVVRKLKELYRANEQIDDARLAHIADVLRQECGESVSDQMIVYYFHDRAYRERRKHQGRTRYVKTDKDRRDLAAMWQHFCGCCPPRGDKHLQEVLAHSGMTYSDVQQWFGQRRHIERGKVRHVIDGHRHAEGPFAVPCVAVPWVNGHAWAAHAPQNLYADHESLECLMYHRSLLARAHAPLS